MYRHRLHIERFLRLPGIQDRDGLDDAAKAAINDRLRVAKDANGHFKPESLETILGSKELSDLYRSRQSELASVVVVEDI